MNGRTTFRHVFKQHDTGGTIQLWVRKQIAGAQPEGSAPAWQ